jgi:O-antigen/teichoic acid export membrane protein
MRLASPGLVAVANRVAAAAAGFAMTTTLARMLPMASFGALSGVIAYLNVAIVCGLLGQEPWSTRQAVVAPGNRRYRHFVYGSVVAAGFVTALAVVATLHRWQPALAAFAGIVVSAPLIALTRFEQGLVRGYGGGEWAGTADGIARPVFVIVGMALVVHVVPGDQLQSGIVALWFTASIGAFALARAMRIRFERLRLAESLRQPKSSDVPHESFSASTYLGTLLSVATNQLPMICVAALASSRDLALYAAADRFGAMVAMLPQAIYQARSGVLAEAHRRGGSDALSVEFMKVTRSGWKISLPVCAALIAAAPIALASFGANFSDASATLRIVCVATLISTLAGPLGTALVMSGQSRRNSLAMMIGGVLQLLLSLALVPRWGALGAASGVLVGTLTWVLLLMWQYRVAFGRLPYQWSPS